MRLNIYIAGPYSADTPEAIEANVQRAIDAGIAVLKKGHIPYIPHLSHWVDKRAEETGHPITWDDWMEVDSVWLDQCDAIWHLASSRGADMELERAKAAGKIIFYDYDDIPFVCSWQVKEVHSGRG